MVEGPKVHVKQQKLQVMVGEVLMNVHSVPTECQKYFGEKVTEVFCVGKELLFVLERACIRLHFGMSGYEVISRSDTTGTLRELEQKFHKKSTGVLIFDKHILTFFETSITLKTMIYAETLKEKACKDVLARDFNSDAVVEWLYLRDTRPLMDSIMDQSILPGVGNVIKCEALFMSRLNPYSTACSLSRGKIVELVKHLRDFSIHWYECTKNKKLKLQKQVYGFSTCIVCHSNVSLVRDGRIQRITYFCPVCQPLSTQTNESQLSVQLSDRPTISASTTLNSHPTMLMAYRQNENCGPNQSEREVIVIDDSDDEAITNVYSTGSSNVSNSNGSFMKPNSGEIRNTDLTNTIATTTTATTISSSGITNTVIDSKFSDSALIKQHSGQPTPPDVSGTVRAEDFAFFHRPMCTCRNPAYLRRVHTAGANTGRVYWACGAGADIENVKCASGGNAAEKKGPKQRCNFFHWADSSFPHCKCGSKTSTAKPAVSSNSTPAVPMGLVCMLRRVLKPGPNNGRYFFSCGSQNSKASCGFFLWAETWSATLSDRSLKRKVAAAEVTDIQNLNLHGSVNSKRPNNNTVSKFTIPL